jgi:hypothetical protein
MNTSIERTIFRAALRIQANRLPPRSAKEWETSLSLASMEIESKVKLVLDTLFLANRSLAVDTRLVDKCSPNLCAEIKSTIIITPCLSPEMEIVVIGTLRQWVHDNDKYYAAIGADVTWISPNVFAIFIEWRIEGLKHALAPHETTLFTYKVKEYLQGYSKPEGPQFDSAFILRQYPVSPQYVQIQGFITGASLENDAYSNYQNQVLNSFNAKNCSTFFLQILSTSIPVFQKAFEVKASLLTLEEFSSPISSSSPATILPRTPGPRNLPFTIDTTKVSLILTLIALGMILCGMGFVFARKMRKEKVGSSFMNETDQEAASLENKENK